MPATRPTRPGDLASPTGQLQMLKVVGETNYEAAIGQTPGMALPVEWVNIADPDPASVSQADPLTGLTISTVFAQGLALGGTRFRRLEGCWYDQRKIYFISTNGGDMGFGQVWVYDIAAETLTLVVESSGHDMFDGPDNCCATPRGGLVFCEDAGAAQHLRGVSPTGEVFALARNLRNTIEFAGVCFSPDGNTLFVNLYGRGNERTTTPYRSPVQIPVGPGKFERAATLAIWGPWNSGPL
jgi:secreted PhoX family phosphatase